MNLKSVILAMACLGIATGCQTIKKADNFHALTVQAGLDGVEHCTGGTRIDYKSPKFKVTGTPEQTKKLRFSFDHIDAGVHHSRATLPYNGGDTIAPGQFEYIGPCPRSQGLYRWTVEALNEDASLLYGKGHIEMTFPN